MKDYNLPPNSIEPMFTIKDTAHILRCKTDQVYKLRRAGRIFFKKNSAGRMIVTESELKRFINEG